MTQERDSILSVLNDQFKDIYGVRPIGKQFTDRSLSELKQLSAEYNEMIDAIVTVEKAQHSKRFEAFCSTVEETAENRNCSPADVIRAEAKERYNNDFSWYFYDTGMSDTDCRIAIRKYGLPLGCMD